MKRHLLLVTCAWIFSCATQATGPSTTAVDEEAATNTPAPAGSELPPPAVNGPTPVGAMTAETASKYPVTIRLANPSSSVLNTGHLGVAVRVFRNGAALEGCPVPEGEAARTMEGPSSIAPGESHVYTAGLPCPLTEPGEYQVHAYVHLAERDASQPFPISDDTYFGSFFMKVSAEMEPFQGPIAPAAAAVAAPAEGEASPTTSVPASQEAPTAEPETPAE